MVTDITVSSPGWSDHEWTEFVSYLRTNAQRLPVSARAGLLRVADGAPDSVRRELRLLLGAPDAAASASARAAAEDPSAAAFDAHRFEALDFSPRDLADRAVAEGAELAAIRIDGEEYAVTPRFLKGLAQRMHVPLSAFDLFSPGEVLRRASLVHPDLPLRLTVDRRAKQALGLVERAGAPLPVGQIERVLRGDPRLLEYSYENGELKALLDMGEEWDVPSDSAYRMRIRCTVPVDEMGDPEIHLATFRQVCSNGLVAEVAAFRSKMQIKDRGGAHFARLLSSFSNPQGVETLRHRLLAAQATKASVGELLSLDALFREHLSDRREQMLVREALMERAGNPCVRYGVADLSGIGQKKRALLPVQCSVADLVNMASEVSTHHRGSVRGRGTAAFDVWGGETLAKPFDLEDLYGNREEADSRYFEQVDWNGAAL